MKLARVLMTAVISTKGQRIDGNAKNAVLAVALLMEEDTGDVLADFLADKIAFRVIERIDPAIGRMTASVDFAMANGVSQAETTLALKDVSTQLLSTTSSIKEALTNASMTPPTTNPKCPTWAEVTATKPSIPTEYNPNLPTQHTQLQQRLLHEAKMVLIVVDTTALDVPVNHSPKANLDLRTHINKLLAEVDKSCADLASVDGVASPPTRTLLKGISWLKRGAYLLKFDTADSAARFRNYAQDPVWELAKTCLGDSAWIADRTFALVIHFVPCRGIFDPSSTTDLADIESENNLPPGSITSAFWLKRADRCYPGQTVASLRVLCNTAQAANHLLRE